MKKIILGILITIMLVGCLAGFGCNNTNDDITTKYNSQEICVKSFYERPDYLDNIVNNWLSEHTVEIIDMQYCGSGYDNYTIITCTIIYKK